MKHTNKPNSKGFAHLEILIIVIVVVAVAAAGFLVYKHNSKSTNSTAPPASKSSTAGTGHKTTSFVSNTPTHPPGIKLPEASANNWTEVTDFGNHAVKVYACQTFYPVYGGVYKITAEVFKPASWYVNGYISATTKGPSQYVNNISYAGPYFYNVVSEFSTYYSVAYANQNIRALGQTFGDVLIGASGLYGTGAYWEGTPATLAQC